MVFGWGKKKEPEYRPRPVEAVALSDVPRIMSELLELRRSQVVSEARSCRERAAPLLAVLAHIGRELERDDLKVDEADKRIRVIVERGKKQVIDIIRKDIVDLPEVTTYDDAVRMCETLGQTLKKIGDVLGRQTRVIHLFAKKYASKLKEILVDIKSINDEARSIMKNFEDSESGFGEIQAMLDEITRLKEFSADAGRRSAALDGSLVECTERMAACTASIQEIKSSEGYARLLDARKEIDRLDGKRAQLRASVLDRFTKISRPLGRYEHTSSLDKEQKQLLSNLINSPFDAIARGREADIVTILENVKKGITSGTISVKDRSKSISQVTEIENELGGMVVEITSLLRQQEESVRAASDLMPPDLAALEGRLAKIDEEKSHIMFRIKSLKEEMLANESRMPQLISGIESKMRRFSNTRYTVIPDSIQDDSGSAAG